MDGFRIAYLRSGPTVLELFTFERALTDRTPQCRATGFAFAELTGHVHEAGRALEAVGHRSGPVHADDDGFTFSICSPDPATSA
jgi:hypothetical protein